MSPRGCPDAAELERFALGDLTGSVCDRLAEHVLTCPHCDTLLQQFDAYEDDLLTTLRGVSANGTSDIPPPPQEVVQLVQRSAWIEGKVSLDIGRRFATQLASGPCRLGKFELQAELGAGSFGHVFKARDTELDRIVALKVQRAGSLADLEDAGRFLREARSVARLQHPGIVALYETGQTEDGVCFLVTEFIDGETLEARLKRGRPEPRWVADLLATVGDALHYAHEHGVIHRDLKPSNILLDHDGRPHLMDFGLAKRSGGDLSMTSDGRVLGTPAYMSPEQARGDSHDVDARTDLYSLGVVLYELLTGVRPFQGDRRLLVLQVLEDDPRPPRRLNENIPRDLETICLKAMAKAPGRRYASARELADDLRRFLDGQAIKARRVGVVERLYRWSRRNPLAASLFLALCLGSAAGFWYLSQLSTYFVQATALGSARDEAAMLEEVNAFYSDIVDRVDGNKTPVTHEYARYKNTLPLPATFLIDAGERISRTESGLRVRLYSDHPWRKDGGSKDTFEATALWVLTDKVRGGEGELTYHEFTESDGRPFLRYAKAQLMKQSCVKCHNADEQSPRRDWHEGDLAGVLSITRPLDRDIARTHAGLRGAFLLTGVIALLPVLFALGSVLRARWQRLARA